MSRLLNKEMRLSASVLSYVFIAFGLMALIPNYPVLLGAFFVTLGIFKSAEKWRTSNDITYSVLLPVSKKDVVKGKFSFAILIEMCGFILMFALTMLRMTVLSDADVYVQSRLMAPNLCFLGFVLLIFGCFNFVFLRGYFRSSYRFGKSFFVSIIVTFLIIAAAEALHFIPGLETMNAIGFDGIGVQLSVLIAGALIFVAMTFASLKMSVRNFEMTDL